MGKFFKFLQALVLLVIIGAIVCCIVGFFCPRFTYLNADNIVITFLGVLATFVVISNFSQVADIRDRTEKELDRMQKQMDLKELEQEKEIHKVQEKIDSTDKELIELKPLFDTLIRKEVTSILNGVNGCFRFVIKEYSFIEIGLLMVKVEVYKREQKDDTGKNFNVNTKEKELKSFIVDIVNKTYNELKTDNFDSK